MPLVQFGREQASHPGYVTFFGRVPGENKMKFGLAMIVKNEAARIERALVSLAPYLSAWVITDTGSTDDTKRKITDFFRTRGIPGEIRDATFVDWSQARNANLNAARASTYGVDYWLLADADMELVVKDPIRFVEHRDGSSYDIYQHGGTCHYLNRRLVRHTTGGQYLGVTHEYLNEATAGTIGEDVAYFMDHADGANRPDKYKRDIRLLKEGLKVEPNNERYFFYLACSYRDAGKSTDAAKWFKRRVDAGGWDEEVWQAQVNYAHCLKDKGDEAGFIRELLVAYNLRPQRAEPMYDLANHYRLKGMNAPALACAESVLHLPPSTDALFVNDYVYKVGLRQEAAITAFYVPGKRRTGYKICSDLAMDPTDYWQPKNEARDNLYHYIEPLTAFCPSFTWKPITFTPPENWIAMNPSVTMHCGHLWCNVRCVNYKINEWGQYLIRGTDGMANGDNPINTRNFLVDLGLNPFSRPIVQHELLPPGNLPCEFPPVIGFEDVRIFSVKGELWSSATVRQIAADGNCEQVLTHLVGCDGSAYRMTDMKRMLRLPRQTEKNWAPLVKMGEHLSFMYRPLELVNTDGETLNRGDPKLAVDNISGGSQLVHFYHGWLALTHEARQIPGKPTRYYSHRFVWYDDKFTRCVFSLPFYFNEKGIEFAAGMCWAPNGIHLVISYGYKDEDARIATVDRAEVEKFLWPTY
jgi:glycosyltransferase involved in cell wall biosynthesis